MSHAALLVFHYDDIDIDTIMTYHNLEDATNQVFCPEVDKEEVADMCAKVRKDYPKEKDNSDEDIMESHFGYAKRESDGCYGYYSNEQGFYDWYEIGGRYEISFPIKNEKTAKKLVAKALYNKKEYRTKLHEYARLKTSNPIEVCAELNLVKNTAYVKDVNWNKAIRSDGGLCYEILESDEDGGSDMPLVYSKKLLFELVERYSKIKNARVTMIDYHS